MEKLLNEKCDIRQLSPLTLAFVGDAVFSLMVREQLACCENRPVSDLHNKATQKVNAAAQAGAMQKIMSALTEQEADFFKRGRNARPGSIPKSATCADYHRATGLETLFGYLYLVGNIDRLRELFSLIYNEN